MLLTEHHDQALLPTATQQRRARRQAMLERALPCLCIFSIIVALFFSTGREHVRARARAAAALLSP